MKLRIALLAATAGLAFSSMANAAGNPQTFAMMNQNDCFSCHAVEQKIVGPAYKDVAARYHGSHASTATIAMLAEKIIKGGNGHWNGMTGGLAMTPHPTLTVAQAEAMAKWVLAQ
ncbi:MAG: cytochrome C [Betaproteobacteria bacterium]|nr:cytochrome C [Betaproteobacteria bacterium]